MKKKVLFSILIMMFFSAAVFAIPAETIDKTFENKDEIRFKLVLGEVELKKSQDNRIHVNLEYSYSSNVSYEPRLRERGSVLYLEEKMRGNNPRGYSQWTVALPDGLEVDFKSATGGILAEGLDIEIDGSTGTGNIELFSVKGKIDLSTGTGNVDVTGSEGRFDVSSGTGDVSIRDSKGDFQASSGTGDVDARGLTLFYEGEFSSGTGDVDIMFPEGTDFELWISSGTDSAVLDMGGKPIQGFFEFTCHKRRGRIVCPVDFDKEETYMDNKQEYLRKSFTRDKDSPKVYIRTGTGTARLNR